MTSLSLDISRTISLGFFLYGKFLPSISPKSPQRIKINVIEDLYIYLSSHPTRNTSYMFSTYAQQLVRTTGYATEIGTLKLKYVSSDITSDMLSNWISRVGSSIPRGFSRHYVLNLLKDSPMTGKEIIDKAVLQSDGKWRPSPGLIYPMLGRLLEEGLIEEAENGRYRITLKGLEMASDVESINNIIQKQLDVMLRFGNVGKFMALDLIDRASAIGTALSSNLDKMTEQEKGKYREFLVSELKKLDDQELKERNIQID
jgi:DNA-binding PadR family transcriptional regulator